MQSIDGVGEVLSSTMLYEIGDIARFERVRDFVSYRRSAPGQHISAGKASEGGGRKMGDAHPKWAFSQASLLLIRSREAVEIMVQRDTRKYGKASAPRRLNQKPARTVYYMMIKRKLFDIEHFLR